MDGVSNLFGGGGPQTDIWSGGYDTWDAGGFGGPTSSGGGLTSTDYAKGATATAGIFNRIAQIIGISRAGSLNARIGEVNAKQALVNAAFNEKRFRREAEKVIGKQRAIGAASGIDIGSGTINEVILESARRAEEEALTIRAGGQIRANAARYRGYLTDNENTKTDFGYASLKSLSDLTGGFTDKNGTILQDLFGKATT